MALHDISVRLGQQNIVYPGDPAFSSEPVSDRGEAMSLTMCAHSGTHLDAPAHFFPEEGRRLDDFSLEEFIMPARVVEILNPVAVQVDDLEGIETEPGEAVLFRTGNSHSGRVVSGVFTEDYIYLTQSAAMWCVDRKLRLAGLDYVSLDAYGDAEYPAHHVVLGHGLLALEGINLADVRPGRYRLICLPLPIVGAEASPVRAVLEDLL